MGPAAPGDAPVIKCGIILLHAKTRNGGIATSLALPQPIIVEVCDFADVTLVDENLF